MKSDTGWLDGLRGFAALIVLFGHCSNERINIIPGLDMGGTAKAGVWLFFMLSAYLLGSKLIEQFQRSNKIRTVRIYAIRRVLRIMPAYVAVLFAITIAGIFTPEEALWHAALLQGRGHFWTMPVEMSFYIILPVVALLLAPLPSERRFWTIAILFSFSVVISFTFYRASIQENGISALAYLPFFFIGILIATCPIHVSARAARLITILGLSTAIILHPRSLGWLTDRPTNEWLFLYLPCALGMGAVFFAAQQDKKMQAVFNSLALRMIGRVSFGTYLVHYFLIQPIAGLTPIPQGLKGLTALAASCAIGAVIHVLFERKESYVQTKLGALQGNL